MKVIYPIVFMSGLLFVLSGCAGTQQMKESVQTGFLGKDYAKLRKGGEDEALMIYKNPKAKWASYDEVMLDPVTIWKDEGTKDVSPEDLQRLANDLWSKLKESLGKDYQIVSQPGPGVMRLQAAITEAEASNPVMDTLSSIHPGTKVLAGGVGMARGGKPSFVGAASAEAKITDSQTGELLAAAVDRRAGTKNIAGSTNSWGDVEDAYQYWAEKIRWRLCKFRGGTNCVEAKA